jgi:hypothetical protein
VEKGGKAIYVQNTEAGARYLPDRVSGSTERFTADEKDQTTDTGLMGSVCLASTGVLKGADEVTLQLLGGESKGDYKCTKDGTKQPAGNLCYTAHDCESYETCDDGHCAPKSCKSDDDCGGFGVCNTQSKSPYCMSP